MRDQTPPKQWQLEARKEKKQLDAPRPCREKSCPAVPLDRRCPKCGSVPRYRPDGWHRMVHPLSPHLYEGRDSSVWQLWPDCSERDHAEALAVERELKRGGARRERALRKIEK